MMTNQWKQSRRANRRTNASHGDHMRDPKFQNWSPRGARNAKSKKVTSREAPTVEKMKGL